jgi:hypothetical protein
VRTLLSCRGMHAQLVLITDYERTAAGEVSDVDGQLNERFCGAIAKHGYNTYTMACDAIVISPPARLATAFPGFGDLIRTIINKRKIVLARYKPLSYSYFQSPDDSE